MRPQEANMPRDHTPTTRAALLDRIRTDCRPIAADAAVQLLELAARIGAREIPGHSSISVRLPAPDMDYSGWLTLYVVSDAGTMYVNWLDRWQDAGASTDLAEQYERDLAAAIGVRRVRFRPTDYKRAVPLEIVAPRLEPVCAIVEATAAALRQQIGRQPARPA
jgi:hypothetical protein